MTEYLCVSLYGKLGNKSNFLAIFCEGFLLRRIKDHICQILWEISGKKLVKKSSESLHDLFCPGHD